MLDAVLEVRHREFGDQRSPVHDAHPVADALELVHQVRGDEDGGAVHRDRLAGPSRFDLELAVQSYFSHHVHIAGWDTCDETWRACLERHGVLPQALVERYAAALETVPVTTP